MQQECKQTWPGVCPRESHRGLALDKGCSRGSSQTIWFNSCKYQAIWLSNATCGKHSIRNYRHNKDKARHQTRGGRESLLQLADRHEVWPQWHHTLPAKALAQSHTWHHSKFNTKHNTSDNSRLAWTKFNCYRFSLWWRRRLQINHTLKLTVFLTILIPNTHSR